MMGAVIRNWPYGFLDDFWCGHQDTENPADNNSPDLTNDKELIGSIEYVLAVCDLNDREMEILRKKYQHNMTFDEIGQSINISGSYAQGICHRAIRKLRSKSLYRCILSRGVAAYARQRYEIRLNEEFNERVEERVAEIRKAEYEQRLRKHPALKQRVITPAARSTKICDLMLSVRSYNALSEAGCRTVHDILALENRDALLSISGLGVKCANEIINLLDNKGYNVRHLR